MSINRTIKTLGIAKSTLYYKSRAYPDRKPMQRKQMCEEAISAISVITGMKSTYGTPRVRAILKRDYQISLSKYMIHRFMKEEGSLITRNSTRGSSRPHTGKITVEQSNIRWASDITSVKCWNAQKLRFTYILDRCDRSIIAWKAGFHMQACDIEIMIQEALFNRFGNRLPEKGSLQFLHDNGPKYIEKRLQKSVNQWQIQDCSTPTYSPQSNGMCEAFNGTFKRDYVYESCLDNAAIVHHQIQNWVNEYNHFAPHSDLNMKTPNEYYNFKSDACLVQFLSGKSMFKCRVI